MTINIDSRCIDLQLPIFERCLIDSCNLYNLILQHRTTKCVTVFKIRSRYWNLPANARNQHLRSVRLHVHIELPEWLETGTYTYYLVSEDSWKSWEVDKNYVLNSYRKTDKEAPTIAGQFLIANGKLIVSSWVNAKICDMSGEVSAKREVLTVKRLAQDERESGKIVECMCGVLATGFLNFNIEEQFCEQDDITYSDNSQDTYTTYKG